MTTTSTTDDAGGVAEHAHFCPTCGTERQAVEPFCAHCGHVFPDAEAVAAPVQADAAAPAPDAPSEPAASPSTPAAPSSGTDRRTIILIAVGAAVAVIALVITLVVLLTGDEDSSSATDATAATWLELVGESVDDLDDDRDALQSALDAQPGTSAGAAPVTAATATYRATLDEWRDDIADLEDEARPTSAERKLIVAAIDKEQELLTAITRISRSPSTTNRNELTRLANASAAAWGEVDDETDGEVEVDPLDVSRLSAWSLRREQQRAAQLRARAAARAAQVRRAEQAAAEARAAAAAAAARNDATGYQSCANIGEGGAGAINIEGTNVSCDDMYSVIYAVPPSMPSSYNAGGFYCEAMDSDASSIAYICQDGDRSFGFRIIDN